MARFDAAESIFFDICFALVAFVCFILGSIFTRREFVRQDLHSRQSLSPQPSGPEQPVLPPYPGPSLDHPPSIDQEENRDLGDASWPGAAAYRAGYTRGWEDARSSYSLLELHDLKESMTKLESYLKNLDQERKNREKVEKKASGQSSRSEGLNTPPKATEPEPLTPTAGSRFWKWKKTKEGQELNNAEEVSARKWEEKAKKAE